MDRYIVAGNKPWSRRVFDEVIRKYPGRWYFLDSWGQRTAERVRTINPRYIFFLHWSWRVPAELIETYECVCFHMADVPYGRGGSPLQSLILLGHRHTKLTALRMTDEMDAGPVYKKKNLCLEGNAEEIYIRASSLAARMIEQIIQEQPKPFPQKGKVVLFRRRNPDQSETPKEISLQGLYDFIRMLDADGYPRAFVNYRGFHYEFSRAALYDGKIVADVTITPLGKKDHESSGHCSPPR